MVKKRTHLTRYIVTVLLLLTLAVLVISAFVLTQGSGAPSQPEGLEIVKGRTICLPHKNSDGPQTMECAMGLQDEKGDNYALSDTDQNYANISSLSTEKPVEVTGTMKPAADSKYQTRGTIEVVKIKIAE